MNYKEWLKDNNFDEQKVHYFGIWVKKFKDFLKSKEIPLENFTRENISSFLNYLSKTKADWQVKQAQRAIEMYIEYISETALKLQQKTFDDILPELTKAINLKSLSELTEQTYIMWIKKFIDYPLQNKTERFSNNHIQFFFNELQNNDNSYSSQVQAFYAINFLFKNVLKRKIGISKKELFVNNHKNIPIILTKQEIFQIFQYLQGVHLLICKLIYGTGMSITEVVSLRIKDINFEEKSIYVRGIKGNKNRKTILPISLIEDLKKQISYAKIFYKEDLDVLNILHSLVYPYKEITEDEIEEGFPDFWVFPTKSIKYTSSYGNHNHINQTTIQKQFKRALHKTKINKKATVHSLRHSFAAHLLDAGIDIKILQKLLGHSHINSTKIYLQVSNKNPIYVVSPVDVLP